MAKLTVRGMGAAGVNVDKNPVELGDDELRRAQNVVPTKGAGSSIKKRFGLSAVNTETDGEVLGGATVPLVDEFTPFAVLYLGRGGEVS